MLYFKKVDRLPRRVRGRNGLEALMWEYYNNDIDRAEITYDDGDYVSPYSCANAIRKACKRVGVRYRVTTINKRVFIERY